MFAVRPMFAAGKVLPQLTCQGVAYYVSNSICTASIELRILPDGTWTVFSANTIATSPLGSPTSGIWHDGGGDASVYVRFTRTASTGDGSAPSTGWLQMNAMRSVNCVSEAPPASSDSDSGTYTIEFATDPSGMVIVSTTTAVVLNTSTSCPG